MSNNSKHLSRFFFFSYFFILLILFLFLLLIALLLCVCAIFWDSQCKTESHHRIVIHFFLLIAREKSSYDKSRDKRQRFTSFVFASKIKRVFNTKKATNYILKWCVSEKKYYFYVWIILFNETFNKSEDDEWQKIYLIEFCMSRKKNYKAGGVCRNRFKLKRRSLNDFFNHSFFFLIFI